MKRADEIEELMSMAESLNSEIEKECQAAISDEEKKSISRVKVKMSLEQLRSALEFCAVEIWESYSADEPKYVKFPYANNKKTFDSRVKSNLKGLKHQLPKVYDLVESLQSYSSGDDWLDRLCELVNMKKHETLGSQQRINSAASTVRLGNLIESHAGSVVISGMRYGNLNIGFGSPFVMNSSRTVMEMSAEIGGSIPITRKFEWVVFEVPGKSSDILFLLKNSHSQIRGFIDKLKQELPKKKKT